MSVVAAAAAAACDLLLSYQFISDADLFTFRAYSLAGLDALTI